MKLIVIAIMLHLVKGASIADVSCPDSCTCEITKGQWNISCVSYEFIKKLLPKQETKIVQLNINNVALNNIDLKLKYLKNLEYLNLANNSITNLPSQFPYLPKLKSLNLANNELKEVVFSQLPKNLEEIDLAFNSIAHFPKDWSSLKRIKTIHFNYNPIDCDCDNLAVYQELQNEQIKMTENLTCHSPKELYENFISSINCSLIRENLLNSMLGDESGSTFEDNISSSKWDGEQEQFIKADEVTSKTEDNLEEGSGDEGSGFIELTSPKACHFNCSTPKPIGLDDETNALPPPKLPDQVKMFFEDILSPDKVTEVSETAIVKETESPLYKESDKITVNSDVEHVPTNDTYPGKMGRASLAETSSYSVYIIIGLVLAFAALLIIYYLNKKKNLKKQHGRKRNMSNDNGFGEEMKPLGKSAEAVKPVDQLSTTKLPNVEKAPLLNGQNGIINGDTVKSDMVPEEEQEEECVELRKTDNHYSLTPQPERVTIKAGEIVDAIPKTPIVVHRQVNNNGDIIITPQKLT